MTWLISLSLLSVKNYQRKSDMLIIKISEICIIEVEVSGIPNVKNRVDLFLPKESKEKI